jgi:sarcosine oxidase subunit beta|tara:strand:+ start:4921 stop:6174 length:1254 start_codon:yes stop_codon:yes gene_type:complete
MQRYSIFGLLRHALSYHEKWQQAWRSPEPKRDYDVVIIGGGGHGLGTAHYLAQDHGITNVAVLEKGWLGGGNTGRNTMTVRSNFLREASVPFHEKSLSLYHGLSKELNYNLMVGKRGMITFLQSSGASRTAMQMANTMHIFGARYEMISVEEIRRRLPIFDPAPDARMPINGGVYQPDATMVRHDAVAWGFARSADSCGIDIIQNCEVTGITRNGNRVTGVETTRGVIKAKKVGMAVAGHGSVVAAMAGLRLPIVTQPLQAWVSEPIKPILDEIVVIRDYFGTYLMQSDKGEIVIGQGCDPYCSYAQRGTFPIIEDATAAMLAVFPRFKRLKLLRHWAGMLDMTYDGSPIISKTDVVGFYIDIAGSGGFKTTPVAAKTFAHLIAQNEPHELTRDLGLDRFGKGHLVVEGGVSSGHIL